MENPTIVVLTDRSPVLCQGKGTVEAFSAWAEATAMGQRGRWVERPARSASTGTSAARAPRRVQVWSCRAKGSPAPPPGSRRHLMP